jgi:multisubunit Na+/H+ antiporter MnhG subunit
MTYYIHPVWFYLMGIVDSVIATSCVFGIFLLLIGVGICAYNTAEIDKLVVKPKWFFIFGGICILITIFVPNKETCKEMMIASVVTEENVSDAKKSVTELVNCIIEKCKEENGSDVNEGDRYYN